MDRPEIKAEKRTVTGRKVKSLRSKGILPANVYGKDIASTALQLPIKEFLAVYDKVGETGLVDLKVDGEVKPVLITNLHLHPVTDAPLHADFRQVDLREKIQAAIPVELVGEPPADKSGVGILVQQLNEIEVEALPANLPEKFTVDVSKLENVDDAIAVKELSVNRSKITVITNEEQIVVKIEPLAAEEAATVAEKAPAEGEEAPAGEGGTPVEGGEQPSETPTEEKKEE